MPSQNESILRHPKEACLGSIISKRSIDKGLIIEQEMAMMAKQSKTSLPFSVMITKLCRRSGVPRDKMRDIEVTPTSSTHIQRIEVEYTLEEADGRRAAPVDASPKNDVEMIPTEAPLPTLASRPSGHDPEDMALSPFCRCEATRLEVLVPWMIESVILATLTPLQESIDTLTARVKTCESRQGATSEARDDVDDLTTSEIPPATTRDIQMDDIAADESEAETDEKQKEVPKQTIYGDMPDLEETIMQSMIQTLLKETSMEGPSGSSVADMTLDTDAQTDEATL
uniref:Putative plant transposon protein domain-containing protein n=1 Tax=Solanum tuberosum TaxID=4113 RepID=M1D8P6_SOLTU